MYFLQWCKPSQGYGSLRCCLWRTHKFPFARKCCSALEPHLPDAWRVVAICNRSRGDHHGDHLGNLVHLVYHITRGREPSCPERFVQHITIDRSTPPCPVPGFQDSRSVLECTDTKFSRGTSTFSDDRFFACSTAGPDAFLWKVSPAVYVLHVILVPRAKDSHLLHTRNGEPIW